MRICRKVMGISAKESYYSVITDCVEIRIWFLTDDIIRIRAGFDGKFAEESYSLVMTAWEDRMDKLMQAYRRRVAPAESFLTDQEYQAVIDGKHLKIVIEKEPFRILIFDREGSLLHADIPDLGYQEDLNRRRIHTSQIEENDCFFGFGEKSGELDKAGCSLSMSPKDAMGYDPQRTDSLYKHIPFYIRLNKDSKKAVGYFYHNTAECDFDLGREKSNYWKRHSRYRTDAGDIDLFFIAGPKVRQVVERYTDLTGKSAMLPRAAFGYLGSSMYYSELDENCDEAIEKFIDTVNREKIPIDGFQLSSGYTASETAEGIKRCVFTWNKKRFKNPEAFFKHMEDQGITVSPNVKPGVLLCHPDFHEMDEKKMFIRDSKEEKPAVGTWWGGPGAFVDFTNPGVRTEWKAFLKKNVIEKGTASVWNDNCEYDSLVDQDARCDLEGEGAYVSHIKSVMSNIMCQMAVEAVEETFPDKRPFIVCRSGHAGIQRYAQTWAGDNLTCWETLKYNIATILGMGLSGVANQGCDIGGFYGPAPEAELMVRWVQNGIFQPRFSIHSVNTDNTVTEPWMYAAYTDLIRRAICLRYRLNPYYYSLAKRAHECGLPIMEAMCSAFQEDPDCYEDGLDFMVGDSLLVANVVEKNASVRKIYFPKGNHFYDFYSGKVYEGGQTAEIPVTIESIPMFLKSGAILPMSTQQQYRLSGEQAEEMTLLCVPDCDSSFVLYEDDGISMDYEKGIYLKTRISMHSGTMTELLFEREGTYISPVKRMLIDMLHPQKAPFYVCINGKKLQHYLYRKEFDTAENGWYYSQTKRSVQIKYPVPDKDYKIEVSFDQFDMIGM